MKRNRETMRSREKVGYPERESMSIEWRRRVNEREVLVKYVCEVSREKKKQEGEKIKAT